MNDTDLAFASIEEIGKLFRKRKLSPVEITKLIVQVSTPRLGLAARSVNGG